MAIGDVVNGISANNTILDYQPASGVEACITSVTTGFNVGIYNGTTLGSSITTNMTENDLKIFVNNTRYLRISAGGSGFYGAYSGVVIK